MPEKEIDRREDIALRMGLCNCDEAYTKRGLTAPDCPYHAFAVSEAMDEYMKETVLEAFAFVALHTTGRSIDEDNNVMFKYKGEWITKEQLFENFL